MAGTSQSPSPQPQPSHELRPSSNRRPRQERLPLSPHSPTRTPSRMKSSQLSLHARSAKIKWELLHGEPCPYARPASAPSAPVPRSGGHAVAQSAARSRRNSGYRGRVLPAGMPGTHQQHNFGDRFLEAPVVLARQQKSFDDATCGGRGVGTSGIPQPHAGTARAANAKRGQGKSTRVRNRNVRRDAFTRTKSWTKTSPSLLEMHQRVINAALLEISRPREGPFENLGERLGGEHVAFMYCPHDGGGRGGERNADSTARGVVRLPAPTPSKPGVRASTTRGKSKALAHAGHLSRPSTGPAFRTPTAGTQHRPEVLPHLNSQEPWKIPLLRVSWNPSGGDLAGDTFGYVECADSDRELLGRYEPGPQEEQTNATTTDSSEVAPQGHSAANNQSGDERTTDSASISAGAAVMQTATRQALEGEYSISALREASAATTVDDDEISEPRDENCAGNSPEEPTVASPTSRIAVTRFVEETIVHVLCVLPIGAYNDTSSGPAANGTTSEIDTIVANESKAMAYTCGKSLLEEPQMATPTSRIVASQYVEEAISRVLRGRPVGSYGESSSGPPAEGTTSEEEAIVANESKAMANRCSKEYVRQGLQAKLAQSFEGRDPGTWVQAGYIDPACKGHLGKSKHGNSTDKMLTTASFCVERDRNTTPCESGDTSPISGRMSGTTTPISSDSSAINFVFSEASSREIEGGTETAASINFGLDASYHELHTFDSTRADGRQTLPLPGIIVDAAATAVEGWLKGVIAKGIQAPASLTTTRDGEVLFGCAPHEDMDEPKRGHPIASGGVQEKRAPDGSPGISLTMALPKGFLKDIVARRASLKPVADSCPTSAAGKEDRHLQLESPLLSDRGAEEEAQNRAAALRKLEILIRTEKLDRYHQVEFSRGELHGEGRHSVVYCARVLRTGGGAEGSEEVDGAQSTAAAGAADRGATAARMARETMVEVLAAAVASAVTTASVEEQALSAIFAAALVDSVIPASLSAAVGALARDDRKMLSTTLAAKEFRYLRAQAPASILRQAHQEACMHLRVLGCAEIVALRGVWLTPRVTLLLEPMSGGNLHRFSRKRAAEDCALNHKKRYAGSKGCEEQRQRSRWKEAAQLVAEAAEGLAALHKAGIVHRDVKSHNVMVRQQQRETAKEDKSVVVSCVCEASGGGVASCRTGCGESTWQAKLGDLGSAALIPPEGQAALTEEIGTSGWMSPEISGGHGYGTPSDVFSLGVLIWDAFVCGAVENPMCGSPGHKLKEGLRPPWPQPPLPMVPSDIVGVVERCWVFEPEARPTAATVAAELRAFAATANL